MRRSWGSRVVLGVLGFCLAGAAGLAPAARAVAGEGRVEGDLGLFLGLPQGEFADNVDAAGYGVHLFGGYRIPRSPVVLGLDFGYLIYGQETRREPFSTTIPDVTVEVSTSNSIVTAGLLLRLQPRGGIFRPYLDGLIGLNHLSTDTSIRDDDGDEVASATNQNDTAFALGGGGGVQLAIYRPVVPEGAPGAQLREVRVGGGVRYIAGGEARYLKEGSIRRENGQVHYDLQQSRTDLVTISVDVTVEF